MWLDDVITKLAEETEIEKKHRITEDAEPAEGEKEEDYEATVKESADVLAFLGHDKEAAKDRPGVRDGTGPYEGSWQAKKKKKKGKRQEMGEDCPKKASLLEELTRPSI